MGVLSLILTERPLSPRTKHEDEATEIKKSPSPSTMHEDVAPLLTKSGRPFRKAARKAHGINTLKPAIKVQKVKIMKLGWNEEDQPTDYDLINWTPFRLNPIDNASLYSSSIASTNSSSSTSSDSDDELTWDCSPEQLQPLFPTCKMTGLT